MIVEPAPTSPRSPARRGLRVIGLTLPVALLVAVVAIGALGPRTEPAPSPAASPAASLAAASPASLAGAPVTPFPRTWIGFRVWSVAEARAMRATQAATGLLAVAGYLSYGSFAWTCADAYLDVDRTVCGGRATLADSAAWTSTGSTDPTGAGVSVPHLHPQFPPGVRGPTPDDTTGSPRAEPIPVVVLGSFEDPRAEPCGGVGPRCDEAFVVERVVWVAGAPWAPTLTVDPGLNVDPNIPEIRASVTQGIAALGEGALGLETAVVLPGELALLDADAAAAIGPMAGRARYRPVTYVRGLVFRFDASQPVYGRDPAVEWVVLASSSGEVLARGAKPVAAP